MVEHVSTQSNATGPPGTETYAASGDGSDASATTSTDDGSGAPTTGTSDGGPGCGNGVLDADEQ
jgi:hypothetical protein